MNARVNPDEVRKADRPSREARPAGALSAREAQKLPWLQTYTGKHFPLTGFTALDIDLFGDVAEGLARICRYGGRVPGNPYSVAQHCVIGADAALEETQDANIAAYFLLHDAHEFITGDLVTPFVDWMSTIESELFTTADVVSTVITTAKARIDRAVWRAAGMPPIGRTYAAAVANYDLRMLATEQRQLLLPAPTSWGAAIDAAKPIPMRGGLKAWPIARAADEYRKRLGQLCPNARRL